jgi:hypothetical protein
MKTGWSAAASRGRLHRLGRSLALAAAAFALLTTLGAAPAAAMAPEHVADSNINMGTRIVDHYGRWHNVGQLLLHVSNLGVFGKLYFYEPDAPSGEWPAGSNLEYLYGAGLWVGGIVPNEITGEPDTLVSAAVYQLEFRPDYDDLLKRIYETREGAANSDRLTDDDDDCGDHIYDPNDPFLWYDEDPLDGIDNDGDGLIDEDFAAISQQMYRMEYEDTYEELVNTDGIYDSDPHTSLGLRVIQESYQWTSELTDDFVGIDYKVINIGQDTIRMAYIGFMVDADAGPDSDEILYYNDDRGGYADTLILAANPNDPTQIDTLAITMCYMFDDPYGEDGNITDGYFGCMFLGHPTQDPEDVEEGQLPDAPTDVAVHAFEIWSSGTEDPDDDEDRYRYLRGAADFPLLDGIDNDDDGQIDEDDEFRVNIDRDADAPQDWRMMLSAGPFREILPGDTLAFQYAFVVGEGFEGMVRNAATAQQIYNGLSGEESTVPDCEGELVDSVVVHWVADTPPPPPNQSITTGDGFVRIEWDDYSETVPDPLTNQRDFYGYQVWKAVGWTRESSEPRDQDWQLILDIDRGQGGAELAEYDTGLDGVGKYAFTDTLVKNGFAYWYSVTAYDSTYSEETGTVYHFGKYSQVKQLVFPNSDVHSDLDDVKVVPNPYVKHDFISRWNLAPDETDPTGEKICFQNLPRDAIVRIYSLGGELVKTLYVDAEETGGDACWNLISRNNQIVVSGVYLYHIDSPVGEKIGKFVIVK